MHTANQPWDNCFWSTKTGYEWHLHIICIYSLSLYICVCVYTFVYICLIILDDFRWCLVVLGFPATFCTPLYCYLRGTNKWWNSTAPKKCPVQTRCAMFLLQLSLHIPVGHLQLAYAVLYRQFHTTPKMSTVWLLQCRNKTQFGYGSIPLSTRGDKHLFNCIHKSQLFRWYDMKQLGIRSAPSSGRWGASAGRQRGIILSKYRRIIPHLESFCLMTP